MRTWPIFGAAMAIAAAVIIGKASSQATPAPGTPQTGYFGVASGHDFPASEAVLNGYRSTQDLKNQRAHVWNVFAGMTEATPDGKYARWETWYSEEETFASGPALQALGPRVVRRRFRVPRQLTQPGGAAPQAAGSGILSFVLFNYETYRHIRDNGLYKTSVLAGLAQTGAPDRTIPTDRTVPEFPAAAMSLKVVWWPVAKTGITAMPIWDGDFSPPANPTPKGNSTWPRVVGIDPTGTPAPDATADVSFAGKVHPKSHIVGLSAFHVVTLDAVMAAQLNANPNTLQVGKGALGEQYQFKAGDYLVLAGMHMTTKEIKDWVWATFWWHDQPNDGPFAQDRPAALGAPWNHYLMNTTYDYITPNAADGGPRTAFNPWLEAGFRNGVNSNCMNCHQRAYATAQNFKPIMRGAPDPKDPNNAPGLVRSDFLWSIPFNAR